jgi:shikimate dehydrogenase
MKQYGLIGYPLSHSFSKRFFSEKFEKEGLLDCSYELFPIPSIDQLPELLKSVTDLKGLNVTIPYKEAVLQFLDVPNSTVLETGACNCIRIEAGTLYGYNTDVIGFEQSLHPLLQPHHKSALILGTGGAAKAVAWVFQKRKIPFQYVSRTRSANTIAYEDLNKERFRQYQIVVNTSPLGMQPFIEDKPSIPYQWVDASYLFYDLIYNPAETLFLKEALLRGAIAKNGLEMLEIQALESWKRWNQTL